MGHWVYLVKNDSMNPAKMKNGKSPITIFKPLIAAFLKE